MKIPSVYPVPGEQGAQTGAHSCSGQIRACSPAASCRYLSFPERKLYEYTVRVANNAQRTDMRISPRVCRVAPGNDISSIPIICLVADQLQNTHTKCTTLITSRNERVTTQSWSGVDRNLTLLKVIVHCGPGEQETEPCRSSRPEGRMQTNRVLNGNGRGSW